MKLVNVEAIWEESLPSDPESWRLEFTIPVDGSGRFQSRRDTFGFSIHGKDYYGQWIVDALKLQPNDDSCKFDHQCSVEAFGTNGNHWYYFDFSQPIRPGNQLTYAVDDDYVFNIVSVADVGDLNIDSSDIGG